MNQGVYVEEGADCDSSASVLYFLVVWFDIMDL